MNSAVTSRPAWAEIDCAVIADNMKELRRVTVPTARIMAVVKANGYGHGAVPISKAVLDNGADYLAVAIFNEAQELREAGITAPILILGYTPDEQVKQVVELDIAQTIYSFVGAEAVSEAAVRLGKKAKIHIKIDTGLGRLGFMTDIVSVQDIIKIAQLPGIEIEGMFTHFSVADDRDKEYTKLQYHRFLEFDSKIKKSGLHIPIKHAANSATLIDLPEVQMDMVRVGITLYGLYPSDEVLKEKLVLKPALQFKAQVAQVKTVPAGSSISYGRRYITDRETVIAIIPVGYADGYSRLLTNKSHVIIHGQKVPVVGTVCMDQFMIDVTTVPSVNTGDEVVLIGRQGDQQITAEDLAGLIGTINYEIVCMISNRVPRIYI